MGCQEGGTCGLMGLGVGIADAKLLSMKMDKQQGLTL